MGMIQSNRRASPYNFYQDIIIMKGGKLTGGLYIQDDEAAKPKYEYQSLDANRQKGAFEKDLDNMLFGGGFGAPPPRRRQPQNTEQGKPAEQPKPSPPAATTSNTITNQLKPVVPVNPVIPPSDAGKNKPSGDVNKSTDSGKNVNPQGGRDTTIATSGGAKVVVNASTNPKGLNTNKEPSILVPSSNDPISNIPIESQPVLPPGGKKIDNYVNPKQPEKRPEPIPSVPAQPAQTVQQVTIDRLHPFSHKNQFNKPGAIRKGKKVAEDFKFAEENVALNSAVDVVRPFEVDRTRQRKLNDFDFKDYEFPSLSVSLGGEHAAKVSLWKAQASLAKTVCFGRYVDPNDVNPGALSNPHFVSTLTAISELQANTKRLIEDQRANSNGFYLIRLFVNSVWRYIAVDSNLPFIDNENAGVYSNPDNEFELAPALIEKAYAKSFGGYDTFSRQIPREYYLRDLTGAPVKRYSIDNPEFAGVVKKALTSGQIVVAVPNEKIASVGLNPNFSYSLINYTGKGSMELRNSFGTLQERSKISFRPQGTFELSSTQVRDFISHVLVSTINSAYFTSAIQSKHRYGFYSSYNFKIRSSTHGFLTASQWDERLFPLSSHYEYSPFHVVLHRTEDNHSVFVNAAFTPGTRNLDLEVSLAPGSYTVFVAANWKHAEYSYNLTFYGSERVDFERVHTSKLPNLISQSLQSLNVENGRRTDLNKNSAQYFLYQRESNLVVLTVENTSDRDGTVTADLSKVKFDHLILLTSHNNEEDYSNKVGGQIDEYKQAAIIDKRWSVFLKGQERFTWVLATDEAYNESNPKKWGFN